MKPEKKKKRIPQIKPNISSKTTLSSEKCKPCHHCEEIQTQVQMHI
jgi:hypothetical protein